VEKTPVVPSKVCNENTSSKAGGGRFLNSEFLAGCRIDARRFMLTVNAMII
jgi:hypothetical protein